MFQAIRRLIPTSTKGLIKYIIKCFDFSNLMSILALTLKNQEMKSRIDVIYTLFYPISINQKLVRFGGKGDGGYLLPDPEDKVYSGLISPGVGESLRFEYSIKHLVPKIVLIDASIDIPNEMPANFVFYQKYLQASSSKDGQSITLKEILNLEFLQCNNLILQMDIEGHEYEVLNQISSEDFLRFSMILIEFHGLEKILTNNGFDEVKTTLEKMFNNFHLVHTHPNNAGGYYLHRFRKYPKVLETTWAAKNLVTQVEGVAVLPHRLDEINDLMLSDLRYPKIYKH